MIPFTKTRVSQDLALIVESLNDSVAGLRRTAAAFHASDQLLERELIARAATIEHEALMVNRAWSDHKAVNL